MAEEQLSTTPKKDPHRCASCSKYLKLDDPHRECIMCRPCNINNPCELDENWQEDEWERFMRDRELRESAKIIRKQVTGKARKHAKTKGIKRILQSQYIKELIDTQVDSRIKESMVVPLHPVAPKGNPNMSSRSSSSKELYQSHRYQQSSERISESPGRRREDRQYDRSSHMSPSKSHKSSIESHKYRRSRSRSQKSSRRSHTRISRDRSRSPHTQVSNRHIRDRQYKERNSDHHSQTSSKYTSHRDKQYDRESQHLHRSPVWQSVSSPVSRHPDMVQSSNRSSHHRQDWQYKERHSDRQPHTSSNYPSHHDQQYEKGNQRHHRSPVRWPVSPIKQHPVRKYSPDRSRSPWERSSNHNRHDKERCSGSDHHSHTSSNYPSRSQRDKQYETDSQRHHQSPLGQPDSSVNRHPEREQAPNRPQSTQPPLQLLSFQSSCSEFPDNGSLVADNPSLMKDLGSCFDKVPSTPTTTSPSSLEEEHRFMSPEVAGPFFSFAILEAGLPLEIAKGPQGARPLIPLVKSLANYSRNLQNFKGKIRRVQKFPRNFPSSAETEKEVFQPPAIPKECWHHTYMDQNSWWNKDKDAELRHLEQIARDGLRLSNLALITNAYLINNSVNVQDNTLRIQRVVERQAGEHFAKLAFCIAQHRRNNTVDALNFIMKDDLTKAPMTGDLFGGKWPRLLEEELTRKRKAEENAMRKNYVQDVRNNNGNNARQSKPYCGQQDGPQQVKSRDSMSYNSKSNGENDKWGSSGSYDKGGNQNHGNYNYYNSGSNRDMGSHYKGYKNEGDRRYDSHK